MPLASNQAAVARSVLMGRSERIAFREGSTMEENFKKNLTREER
jgi:hypothetical protein